MTKNKEVARKRELKRVKNEKISLFNITNVIKTKFDLWLDVDKTLLHAKGGKNNINHMNIVFRPNVEKFSKFCYYFANSVNIFTADNEERTAYKLQSLPYLRQGTINTAFNLKEYAVESETHVKIRPGWSKMKVIDNYSSENTIIIDDIADYYSDEQRCNVIQIKAFLGEEATEIFSKLIELLKSINNDQSKSITEHINEAEIADPDTFKPKTSRIK